MASPGQTVECPGAIKRLMDVVFSALFANSCFFDRDASCNDKLPRGSASNLI